MKRILKLKVNSLPKDPEHMVQYPGAVGELPQWLLQRGYDPDDGPTGNELSLYDLTESKVALRSNSKLLTKNQQTQQTQVVPQEAASSSTGFDMGNPFAMEMLQMMNMMNANMQNMMNNPDANFNLSMMKPPGKAQNQKALPAPPAALALEDSKPTEDPSKLDKTPLEAATAKEQVVATTPVETTKEKPDPKTVGKA